MNDLKCEPLLRKIQDWLLSLENPELFDMRNWSTETHCGIMFCIAGKGLDLAGYEPFPGTGASWWRKKQGEVGGEDTEYPVMPLIYEVFGLTGEQGNRLFYHQDWPDRFRSQPITPTLAAERIEYFIQSGGKE